MMLVVLDSNIYISAILFGGKAEEIWQLVKEGVIENLISEAIIAEIAEVFRKKFDWTSAEIALTIEEIRQFSILTISRQTVYAIVEDDTDNRILECAVEGEAQYIVSGDHHLKDLQSFHNIRIVSPREFLQILKQQERSE